MPEVEVVENSTRPAIPLFRASARPPTPSRRNNRSPIPGHNAPSTRPSCAPRASPRIPSASFMSAGSKQSPVPHRWILLPEGITGFGMELDSRFVKSVSLIDGALPAQFDSRPPALLTSRPRTARKRGEHRLILRRQQQPHGAVVPNWRRQWQMTWCMRRLYPRYPRHRESTHSDNAIHDITDHTAPSGTPPMSSTIPAASAFRRLVLPELPNPRQSRPDSRLHLWRVSISTPRC